MRERELSGCVSVYAMLVDALRTSIARDPDVVFAYVFGSQATGDAGKRLDVDLAASLKRALATDRHDLGRRDASG